MAAQRVWITTCEICEQNKHFDGTLTVEQLGDAARAAGWDLPVYGGMFCQRCTHAVKMLAKGMR